MKKTAIQICSVIGFGILMAVVSAQAQTQYRAHIPFDFTIGQKSYKAGNYVVDMLRSDTGNNIIVIRDASGRNSYMRPGMPGDDYSKNNIAKLVFDRHGTQHSLAVISTPSFIVRWSKSKAKESLARDREVQRTIVALTRK